MKIQTHKNNRVLILCIYLLAFVLMTWSFTSHAEEAKIKKAKQTKDAAKIQTDVVTMNTSLGKIVLKLNSEKAPISTENFLKYVDKKHYDNTIFHRVIKDFMIQGGGFTEDMKEKETLPPIKNEATNGLSNKRGTISMARTNEINSATAQFFINVVDNYRLDHVSDSKFGYAVFGEVIEGMDVVDKIREVETGSKGQYDDVPNHPIFIKSIKRGLK